MRSPLFTWPQVYRRAQSGVNTFLGEMQIYFQLVLHFRRFALWPVITGGECHLWKFTGVFGLSRRGLSAA